VTARLPPGALTGPPDGTPSGASDGTPDSAPDGAPDGTPGESDAPGAPDARGPRPLARRLGGPLRRLRRSARAWADLLVRLWPYARRRRRQLALTLALSLLYMGVRLLEPWPLKLLFDNVLLGQPLPAALSWLTPWLGGSTTALLGVVVAAILAVAALSGALYYQQSVLSAQVGQRVVADLRGDLYRHLTRLSFSFHDRRRTGDLLVRLTSDIRMLRMALVKMPVEASENVLLIAGMSVIMLVMDWRLALLAFALLPALGLLVRRYRSPMKAAIRKQREQEGHLASVATDTLGAIRVVQSFGLEEQEIGRFSGANARELKQGVKAARLEAKLRWTSDLAVGAVTAVVVGLATRRILSGELTPGDLIVFVTYLRAYARPLRRVSRTVERFARTAAAGERIFDLLDRAPEVRDRKDAVEAPRLRGRIELDGVALKYSGTRVLDGVSLTIEPGEHVAVVGPTGAGKSSLVSLIPRFYDPYEGAVLIDGRDVRELTLASLRRQVALLFQEPVLFATTIAQNIAGGKPAATRADVEDAARRAGIHDVIAALPEGYDTLLGERGGTLSGGQRQCVAIARAILRDAPIVILDEPTTGLDLRASALVTEALARLVEGRTVLLISHDLQRLSGVDRVVVLDRGRIVQQGTLEEVRRDEGLFRDLRTFGESRGST
jgi:ATP-binding cassette subfamily B protein